MLLVRDEGAEDGVGQPSLQAAQGLHRGLGLGELAALVGPALGVVADLHDRGDVQHVVEPAAPGPGQAVSDLVRWLAPSPWPLDCPATTTHVKSASRPTDRQADS